MPPDLRLTSVLGGGEVPTVTENYAYKKRNDDGQEHQFPDLRSRVHGGNLHRRIDLCVKIADGDDFG